MKDDIIYNNSNLNRVHFLHIGKTGGSALKYALKDILSTKTHLLILHEKHHITLKHLPKGEKVIFAVRNPVERYISGFCSRLRKGRPKYNYQWSKGEEEAFTLFNTPNELAISLSSKDVKLRSKAFKAMRSIQHVRSSYWDWFINEEFFYDRIKDVLFVCQQEQLDDDFDKVKNILNIPESIILPNDAVLAHKNPFEMDRELSNKAIENLKEWYTKDYEFLKLLENNNFIYPDSIRRGL